MTKPWIASFFVILMFLLPLRLRAQETGCAPLPAASSAALADSQSERIARLEQQLSDSRTSADNGWILMCSALVLMMTGPGLALFYGGLVRKKMFLPR